MAPRYDSKREIFLWFLTNANVMVVAVPRVIVHQLFQVHGVQLAYQPIFVGAVPVWHCGLILRTPTRCNVFVNCNVGGS